MLFFEEATEIINTLALVILLSLVFSTLLLFWNYIQAFGPTIKYLFVRYFFAIVLFVTGCLLIGIGCIPIETEGIKFSDLSYSHGFTALVGVSIIAVPALIFVRTIAQFRQKLMIE